MTSIRPIARVEWHRQYFFGSTRVLTGKYCSTSEEVLERLRKVVRTGTRVYTENEATLAHIGFRHAGRARREGSGDRTCHRQQNTRAARLCERLLRGAERGRADGWRGPLCHQGRQCLEGTDGLFHGLPDTEGASARLRAEQGPDGEARGRGADAEGSDGVGQAGALQP